MKLLLTVSHYFPACGGAERVVQIIAEKLADRGHEVAVATSHNPDRAFTIHNGVSVHSFPISGDSVKGIHGPVREYQSYLCQSHFDVIMNYAAQIWTTDLMMPLIDSISAAKVLAPCGYSGLVQPLKRLLYWRYFQRLPAYLRKYDHIIYHSEKYVDAQFGQQNGIEHFSVIPNGILAEELNWCTCDFRQTYGIDTRFMLLNVSNHFRLKGHKHLFEILRLLEPLDVTLVLIGNRISGWRGCFGRCSRAAASVSGRVKLLDGVPREHVIAAFQDADLFVLTSEVECFPLVLLEAIASKTPFVSFDVGAARELPGGVVVKSAGDAACHIRRLLGASFERDSLAESAHASCVTEYSWDRIVDKYEAVFSQVAQKDSR